MKILFVTFNGLEDGAFGGAKASIRNYELLKNYAKVESITIRKKSSLRSLLSVLQGYFPPADDSDRRAIADAIEKEAFDAVFFDGSHFGRLVRAVKAKGIPAIVFFHNCEYDYIEVRFGQRNSLKKTIYKRMIQGQERLAAQLADRTVTFTERDAGRVRELYGVKVTNVIPLSVRDVYEDRAPRSKEPCCLLFGPLGQANEDGFDWFVKNVSPALSCRTLVAGRGMERYRDRWNTDRVTVMGTVDDIAGLYADAACVAIPLFAGGGMKIKTAEALMFGKQIFGTDEAYVGYDRTQEGVGTLCNTAEEFVQAINAFLAKDPDRFQPAARELYERGYSLEASRAKFGELLEQTLAASGKAR